MLKILATGKEAYRLLDILEDAKPRIIFYRLQIGPSIFQGDITKMILTDSQKVNAAIRPTTKKGHPAQVDGSPAWLSSDPAIASVTPAPDGLSAVIKAEQNLGHVQVSVSADADLGEGVKTISGVLEIDVVAGAAANLSIITEAPAEQE